MKKSALLVAVLILGLTSTMMCLAEEEKTGLVGVGTFSGGITLSGDGWALVHTLLAYNSHVAIGAVLNANKDDYWLPINAGLLFGVNDSRIEDGVVTSWIGGGGGPAWFFQRGPGVDFCLAGRNEVVEYIVSYAFAIIVPDSELLANAALRLSDDLSVIWRVSYVNAMDVKQFSVDGSIHHQVGCDEAPFFYEVGAHYGSTSCWWDFDPEIGFKVSGGWGDKVLPFKGTLFVAWSLTTGNVATCGIEFSANFVP